MKNVRRLINLIAVSLLIASIVQELRKPPEERTWHGLVAGFVPYDLRVPTLARARLTFWNPSSSRLVVPTLFGVGWTFNLHALAETIRGL